MQPHLADVGIINHDRGTRHTASNIDERDRDAGVVHWVRRIDQWDRGAVHFERFRGRNTLRRIITFRREL